MRRHFLSILRIVCLLLCAAVIWSWIRSYGDGERLRWARLGKSGSGWTLVNSRHGVICVFDDRLKVRGPIAPERIAAALPRGPGIEWEAKALPVEDVLGMTPWRGFAWKRTVASADEGEGAAALRVEHRQILAAMPYWALALASGVWPVISMVHASHVALRGRGRRPRGLCLACGYDLRASAERCPECGTIARPAGASDPRYRLRRIMPVAIALATITGIASLALWRVGAFKTDAARLGGDPSWFAIGGNVYHTLEIAEAEKAILKVGEEPKWFECSVMRCTRLEREAWIQRAWERVLPPQSLMVWGLNRTDVVPRFGQPTSPRNLPTEDRGARLDLAVAPGTDPGLVSMSLRLSASTQVRRKVEHRQNNVVPVLFAAYIDGRARGVTAGGWQKSGGAAYQIPLVKAGQSREWQLRIDSASLQSLLPDSNPHTLTIVAAFSELQHEPADWNLLGHDTITEPAILIRSDPVTLRWTGAGWELPHK